MAALEDVGVDFVKEYLVDRNKTVEDLSELLKEQYANARGFSIRSIERFCKEHAIKKKSFVPDESLDVLVEGAVSQVGPVYGRKMMKGYLESLRGATVASQYRIGKSLARVSPFYHQQRCQGTERQTNPIPYSADYFGHKLHMDQNEKLAMYGITHVCAIDGFSRYIPAYSCMPVKNNFIIYDEVFRKVVLEEGLFDQIRVDHGKEFYLTLYGQECLAQLRGNPRRDPHRQTESKKNLRIERFWVEVNARVNFPIKNALRLMEADAFIDMEVEETKFCVAAVSRKLAMTGLQEVVQSWNWHPIPGAGKPIDLRNANNNAVQVDPQLVPSAEEAGASYEALGGRLTRFPSFGTDPLGNNVELVDLREQQFTNIININEAKAEVVNGRDRLFQNAVQTYVDITRRLSN